jgi:hypothetical protein
MALFHVRGRTLLMLCSLYFVTFANLISPQVRRWMLGGGG